jgi:hypothetical protein
MFELLGFGICVLIMGGISLFWVMIFFNNIGQYDIGGKPNTLFDKLLVMIAFLIVAYGWFELYQHMPFTFSLKHKE